MKVRTFLVCAIVSMSLYACGGSGNSSPPLKALVSIAVTPSMPNVPKGLTQQFKATGTFSDTSTADLTATVAWASATPAVATIDSASGLAKG
jgi:trimeric autotransporter adhesin